MIIHLKSIPKVQSPKDFSINSNFNFKFRMWQEIQKKAELELIHVLIMSKLPLIDTSSAPSLDDVSPDTFYQKGPPSDAILNRWQLIIDLYKEHGFI